jgi:uncharacterized surface protein with fasciclin (FAS1) repeats
MNIPFKSILFFIAIALITGGCRKKAWDDYYSRPDNLEPPIYQVLASKGNFKEMLACIDKAGYKTILSSAGYWTLFAPNDEAFAKYFQENGISGISQMDSVAAQKIVRYCLVYNSFNKDRLDDYQSTAGWVADNAFKRRTAYYELFDTATVNGNIVTTIASNRNNTGTNNGYIASDNNNKHIPFFTNPYFSLKTLTAADYSFFYPNTTFTGLNVVDAKIVASDIPAENGTIHVIDKVLTPLPSLDKYLASKPEYSLFKSLFDRFLVGYYENTDASNRFRVLNNRTEKVYVKLFDQGLAFAPNNENFLKTQDNDGQSSGWTMFVPTNTVLETYLKNVLLEHYGKDISMLNKLPTTIISDFVNGHLWQAPVWPSQFASTINFIGEPARFTPATDVVDKKILSNGFFYGTSKVQASNWFSTVFSRPYLDPAYSLMTRGLNIDLRTIISNPNFKYTIFMIADSTLRRMGYDWSAERNTWKYTVNGVESFGATPQANLLRIIKLHVIATPSGELNNLSGSGIIDTYGGELITYNNYTLQAAGNIDSSTVLTTINGASVTASNGIAHYAKGLVYPSTKIIGKRLEELAALPGSPYSGFVQYLKGSTLYTVLTGEIKGVPLGTFATFLIPDNAAIAAAVTAGVLPATTTPTVALDQEKVAKFIKYHILKRTVIANGKDAGGIETLLRNQNDEAVFITAVNTPGSLSFIDATNHAVSLATLNSNVLADRIVIHSINTYLK